MSDTGSGQPEYLGSDDQTTPAATPAAGSSRGRRTGIIVGAAVAVVAVGGAAAFGLAQFLGGGDDPASAIPGDAIGYVSLDLDPSAAQKIEAIKILRKFPELRKEIKIGSRDDIRRRIFDEIKKDGDCKSLDYDDDVKPWLGNRIALAAVPGSSDKVVPLVALQVSDEDKAKAGWAKLDRCDTSDDATAIAFSGDYMLIGEKQAQVDTMAKDADSASLADDDDFKTWMDRAGDSGIVTMYAAKDAAQAAFKAAKADAGSSELGGQQVAQYEKLFKDFDGAAGVVRFKDGAVEADFQSKGVGGVQGADQDKGPDVSTLPGTTAAVLSLSLQDDWLDKYVGQIKDLVGAEQFDQVMSQAEQQTGLQLPEDIETLLGNGLSVSVDSSADLEKLSASPDPTQVPAGIRITGDADKITAIIDKLKSAVGSQGQIVKVDSSGDEVAVGFDEDYVSSLLKKGDLGSKKSFKAVVPEASRSSVVLYLDFDANADLLDQVAQDDPDVAANLKPLDAFGVSGWVDDDKIQHSLIRLTTD